MRLRVCVGDLVSWRGVDAIAVSANRALQGNASPRYWRFSGRESVDGSVRLASGEELAQAAKGALACTKWGRVDVGEAVATPAFGAVAQAGCRHVIHVVVPDGAQVHAGGSDHHVQQTAIPMLHQSFCAVLNAAMECGAHSVGIPALGCGVKLWKPRHVADVAARVVADAALECGTLTTRGNRVIGAVDFVMRTDDMAWHWVEAFETLFGPSVEATPPQPLANGPIATWDLCRHMALRVPARSAGLAAPRGAYHASAQKTCSSADEHQVKAKRALLTHRTLQRVCDSR